MGKKARQNKKPFFYMMATLIVTIVAFLVMPRIIDFIASYLYKFKAESNYDDDEWGPEIVKKSDEIKEAGDDEEL